MPWNRFLQGFCSSPSSASLANAASAALETVRLVEAKYPALLFKQQLTAYVEKNLWNHSWQPEKGVVFINLLMHPGTFIINHHDLDFFFLHCFFASFISSHYTFNLVAFFFTEYWGTFIINHHDLEHPKEVYWGQVDPLAKNILWVTGKASLRASTLSSRQWKKILYVNCPPFFLFLSSIFVSIVSSGSESWWFSGASSSLSKNIYNKLFRISMCYSSTGEY